MSATSGVTRPGVDLVINLTVVPVLFVVAFRWTRRWWAGMFGKALSLAAAGLIAFHVGAVLVPLGAIVAVAGTATSGPTPTPYQSPTAGP